MNVHEVMQRLEALGTAQTRKTFANHGAPTDMFGVKVADLKIVAKQIKGQQELAMELYDTGNSDAMYLAGMIADGAKMNRKQLQQWATKASWYMIGEYTVPGVACENPNAWDLGLKWIAAKKEGVAACGWNTLSGCVAIQPDESLDLGAIMELIDHVQKTIHDSPNRVRYTMNSFVISVGVYVTPLRKHAIAAAKAIGPVNVNMGNTACKVPLATEYIEKSAKAGSAGKKRKTIKC